MLETADLIAIYGAGLSTVLAAAQGGSAWRGRVRVQVEGTIAWGGEGSFGTPVMQRTEAGDVERYLFVEFTVRNIGGKPVQITAVAIEAADPEMTMLHVSQLIPADTLPIVIDPGSSVVVRAEKEHLDSVQRLMFMGVVDGTGQRHPMSADAIRGLLEEVWRLPTRAAVYRQHGYPDREVVAFQVQQEARIAVRPLIQPRFRKRKPVAQREKSFIDTLRDGDQLSTHAPARHGGGGL